MAAKKTTPAITVGDKVKVKLEGRWKPGRVKELTNKGRVAHVEMEGDALHRSIYCAVSGLRLR